MAGYVRTGDQRFPACAPGCSFDDEDDTAYVEPSEGIDGELKTKLGWGSDAQSEYPLRNDAIDELTDGEIRLRGEY